MESLREIIIGGTSAAILVSGFILRHVIRDKIKQIRLRIEATYEQSDSEPKRPTTDPKRSDAKSRDSDREPYSNLEAFHAITTVLAVTTKDGSLVGATLNHASPQARLFFGDRPGALVQDLNSKTGDQLFRLLQRFMEPDEFKRFTEDQIDVFNEYNDGHTMPIYAKIPAVFNQDHPNFPNCAFLPVIVSRGQRTRIGKNHSERLVQIVYLNMENFIEPVDWCRGKISTRQQ